MPSINTILILVVILLWSCASVRQDLDKVSSLSDFRETEFIPTLEHSITKDKNHVYSSSLLYAWNELPKITKGSIQVDTTFHDLYLFNKSKTYENTLQKNEYLSIGQVNDGLITVKAEFTKSLPFEVDFVNFQNELTFKGRKTSSFGMSGHDHIISSHVRILFYKDDNNFIIEIAPKDRSHQIILYKTETDFRSMIDIIKDIEINVKEGRRKPSADYYWNDLDTLMIPKIAFNIEARYQTLEGKSIKSNDQDLFVQTLAQRIEFHLDEKGAKVESDGDVVVVFSEPIEGEIPKPKRMLFDQPFFLMLKRTESKNPYLALWISNTELMDSN